MGSLLCTRKAGWTFGNGVDAQVPSACRGFLSLLRVDSLTKVHGEGPHSQRDRAGGFLPSHESEAAVTGVVSMAPLLSLPERAEAENHPALAS